MLVGRVAIVGWPPDDGVLKLMSILAIRPAGDCEARHRPLESRSHTTELVAEIELPLGVQLLNLRDGRTVARTPPHMCSGYSDYTIGVSRSRGQSDLASEPHRPGHRPVGASINVSAQAQTKGIQ